MNKATLPFFIGFGILFFTLLAINLYIAQGYAPILHLRSGALLLLLVSALNLFSFWILHTATSKKPATFIRVFMGVMAARLLLYILTAVFFLLVLEETPRAVLIHFLVYYIMFTALETYMLIRRR